MKRRRMMMAQGGKEEIDYSLQYFTLKALQAGTFKHTAFPVDYSVDGGSTWSTLSEGSSTPTVQAGTKVMFRGTISPSFNGIGVFSGTGNFEAEGNVMSLLYGDNFVGQVDLTGKIRAFKSLFSSANKLVKAKNLSLPATTLEEYCYYDMFNRCTSLTTAPKLPATTLAYNCYLTMFYGCKSLTTAPDLPAETLVSYCYAHMFYGCSSLTTAPKLPATTLSPYCYYYMFRYCTSLVSAPELPATTLVPHCYDYMFNNCTKLNYIKAMFLTTPSLSYTDYWVESVASSGTFVKNSAATWNERGYSGVPGRWTVETATA